MSASSKESLSEDPFSLIEKGIALERARNQWGASDFFSRASVALSQKSKTMMESTSIDGNDEQQKIANLFYQESIEYFNRARELLLEAIEFEQKEDLKRSSVLSDEEDKKTPQDSVLMSLLSEEESRRRMQIFHRLFASSFNSEEESISGKPTRKNLCEEKCETSTPIQNLNGNNANEEISQDSVAAMGSKVTRSLDERLYSLTLRNDCVTKEDAEERTIGSNEEIEVSTKSQETSLEERLAALESSLGPKQNLKSDSRRLDEIHSGLTKIGVHIPQRAKGDTVLNEKVISEEEQIGDIINYAKDEVLMDGTHTNESTDIEELLKRAGIRLEIPHDDQFSAERYLSSDTESIEIGDLKKDDLRNMLEKTQQLLLQVSLCLEEEEEEEEGDSKGSSSSLQDDTCDEDELMSSCSDSRSDDGKQSADDIVKKKKQKVRDIGKDKLLEAKQYMELLTKSLTGSGSQKH